MNLKVTLTFFVLLSTRLIDLTYAQSLSQTWSFDTGSSIIATPLIHENILYVGDESGVFHAIDIESGSKVWDFSTNGYIQAQAILIGEKVFFESANDFYLLNSKTGELIWVTRTNIVPHSYYNNNKLIKYKADPWDDKRSSGIYYNGLVYVGTTDGYVLGLDEQTGERRFKVSSINNSTIRTTPNIYQNSLIYGDWNGRVYKYNLDQKDFEWIKKTYRGDRPYSTFGGVVSSFVVHNNRIFFGARNHMLNVLYLDSGEKEWTFADPKGGWIIGDPVIDNNVLYIGGSDNFTMYAFSTNDGRNLWAYKGEKNIFSRPLIVDDYVIYTGGNGYDYNDSGILTVLDRESGKLITETQIPKAVFSSPIIVDEHIYFGSYDGKIYNFTLRD